MASVNLYVLDPLEHVNSKERRRLKKLQRKAVKKLKRNK